MATEAVNYKTLMTELHEGKYRPVYFLMGEEPYYIDLISAYIEANVLTAEERDFNQIVLFGRDTDADTIINTARRFPMMAARQVVIVKEAQFMKDIDRLHLYTEQPLKSTVLVINYKNKVLDKRLKLTRQLQSMGGLFESKKLYDNQIPDWISGYLAPRGRTITPEASLMLSEYLGADLSKLVNELDKLLITLPAEEKSITPAHIERNIGISKDYNVFEFQGALAERNTLKAHRIALHFAGNPGENPLIMIIGTLASFFIKLLQFHYTRDRSPQNLASVLKVNPYFIRQYEGAARKYNRQQTAQAISLLRQYDARSKGVENGTTGPDELLRELTIRLLRL
jgi:DNA polymerase-3 subunit delta